MKGPTPWYRNYVLGVLTLAYLLNSLDRSIMGVLLEPIGREFGASDSQLGLLSGLAFAACYSTLAIPVAAWADRTSRRNVLACAILLWSVMTALCGLAGSFAFLLLARMGTGAGEAGGNPPSHSLIADYFTPERRATAFAIFALGAPAGAMLAGLLGGHGNELLGWRTTMILAGLPGLLLAPLIFMTVAEPGQKLTAAARAAQALPLKAVALHLWQRRSFRHLCIACSLHSVALYSAASFNTAYLMRSHGWGTADAGKLVALVGAAGLLGTFLGGFLSDRLATRSRDARWHLWVPGVATLVLIPFQFVVYLSPGDLWVILVFPLCGLLGLMFFCPSFAMVQALAAPRMRAVAASVLLFAKAMVGMGLGPLLVGVTSDLLAPMTGQHSLRYALLLAPVFNLWSAVHFYWASRSLRHDLAITPQTPPEVPSDQIVATPLAASR